MTIENRDRSQLGARRPATAFGAWRLPNLSAHVDRSSRVRLLILVPLALFLLWEVLTRSLVAYLADSDPEAVLRLDSTNPTALLNLAEDSLNLDENFRFLAPVLTPPGEVEGPGSARAKNDVSVQDSAPADTSAARPAEAPTQSANSNQAYALIRTLAERSLREDPLNARAFRILGQVSERMPDKDRTEALMQGAVRRSLLESIAVYWMMRKSYHNEDYPAALRYADTLLRTRPQALVHVMPMLGKIAENPEARDELKQLLVTNPPWRTQFFGYLPKSISDARTPIDILLALNETSNPPTPGDLRNYLEFLIQQGFYELAYYTWLQFLPQEQLAKAGRLFNGTFDIDPSGVPFDWMLIKGTGVTPQIAANPDKPGERVLSLVFGPGRVEYRAVSQLVLLKPGSYRFRGAYKADLVSQRGLEWRISCVGAKTSPIGQSSPIKGSTTAWTEFELSFTVPESDCPAQYVSLVFDARSASERFISGHIWYDDLQLALEPSPNIGR